MSCCSSNRQKPEEHDHSHGGGCCSKPSHPHSHQEEDHQEHHHGGGCCSAPSKKSSEKKTITRHMTIEEILGMFPYKAQKLSQEITNAGLHCVGCQSASWETLEAGMLGHGKTEAEIDELVRRLNALLEAEADLTSITLTPSAAAKFLSFASDAGKQGWGIRFEEELAGCNGFEYSLDFSEKADEEDQIFVSQGIEIHIKKALIPRLIGSEIDYKDGLRGSGFVISNPNVRSSCGCGSSHGYN